MQDLFRRRRLPVVLQAEASECGLACLAMVAAHHGQRRSLAELRASLSISLKGMTLRDLIDAADSLGLAARALRCELDELQRLKAPAILHWNMNHFVVLARADAREAVIHDPAHGRRRVPLSRISGAFTGVALELTPTPAFAPGKGQPPPRLREFWSRIRGLAASLWQLFALSLLLQVFALVAPLVNQLVVDEAIGRQDVRLLETIILGFAVLAVVQTAIGLLRTYIGMYLGNLMTFQMRANLFHHLLRLPLGFFEKRHIGDVITRFESLGPVQELLTTGVMRAALDGLLAIGTLAFMLFYAPALAGVVIAFLVLQFLVRLASFPYVRELTELGIQTSADTKSHFLESIRAVRAIKLFGREDSRHAAWQNLFADQLNAGIRLTRFGAWAGAGRGMLGTLETLLVLYLGALAVMDGRMTLGMLFAFQAYRASFTAAAGGLVGVFFEWRLAGLHLQRLADIVQTAQEPALAGGGASRAPLTGRVALRGLRFRYGDNEPWIIDGLSLEVAPGERVAIVGPSGAGKSTLIKLITGLHDPAEGTIVYDGRPLSFWGLRAVRARLGVVMQDDRLLSGSLVDNIAFFDPDVDMARVERCAQAAHIHDEITAMPMGYRTLVGDMGSTLSAGQLQRVLLARALYSEPALLVLDEGTANLDAANERRIVAALCALPITQIIIAHRPQAIAAATRVVALVDGRLRNVRRPLRQDMPTVIRR
ncbi:MAG: peptidase domain-containing ABC transporter [Gammaproteobacteria bacterium]|nr:MAG: peptidase domain-containing ABC transporter [Gammaproteobacteria bacterium]